MIGRLSIFLVLVLFSQSAWGVTDPRSDVIGVYFDEFGDQICEDTFLIGLPFSVWIVYTNPSVTSILGYELGYYTTSEFIQLGLLPPCGLIWIVPMDLENLFVTCGSPNPTSQATPLLRIDYLFMGYEDPDSIFYVEKARDSVLPGTNPYIILADGSFMEAQAGIPAYTTLCCGLPTEILGWGSVKSLYR